MKISLDAPVALLDKMRRHGIMGSVSKVTTLLKRKSGYTGWRFRNAPHFADPSEDDLASIEKDLRALGIDVADYVPNPSAFRLFQAEGWFPPDYHGGSHSPVWNEKLLEHWISFERLGLTKLRPEDIYVDVAAAGSPWARILRERRGISAFAIDIAQIGSAYRHLPYYKVEDATDTSFPTASVSAASLQCAFEMFLGDDDSRLMYEIARILRPGGKIIILPLYLHTHYSAYSSPEYFGKGHSDPLAKEYVRLGLSGIRSSRKYDAITLKKRVLDPILAIGMQYRVLALRNKHEFGEGIYCHFLLEIEK